MRIPMVVPSCGCWDHSELRLRLEQRGEIHTIKFALILCASRVGKLRLAARLISRTALSSSYFYAMLHLFLSKDRQDI